MCVRERVCVRECVSVCVRVSVRECVCVCLCEYTYIRSFSFQKLPTLIVD